MDQIKWFGKIDTAQAEARHSREANEPLGQFDFAVHVEQSWFRQRLSRFIFRIVIPAVFALLRLVWPVAKLKALRWIPFLRGYSRLVLVARYDDVRSVLENPDQSFNVAYSKEMQELGGGTQGVLGLDGPRHGEVRHQVAGQFANPELIESDLALIREWTREAANALLDAGNGRIDTCRDLITRTATEATCRYLGIDPGDPDSFAEWSLSVSMQLFADPTGDPVVGRNARIASAHMLAAIDDAIEREERNFDRYGKDDTPAELAARAARLPLIFRLRRLGGMNRGLTRATVIGLATGFIPANTLAGGNMLEELLSNRSLMRLAQDAAVRLKLAREAGDAEAEAASLRSLEDVLLAAGRKNTALSPGVWRHSPSGGVIRRANGRDVGIEPDSVLVVSLMSAMRDGRMPRELADDPRRAAWMMFGHGPHECLGARMALAHLTEVFAALLAREGIRLAPGRDGRMWRAGPYPVRCEMVYASDTDKRALIVIGLPVRDGVSIGQVRVSLDAIGNPMRDECARDLTATGRISFASINVIEACPDEDGSVLLMEINGDGDEEGLIRLTCRLAHRWLAPVFAHCTADGEAPATPEALADLMISGMHHLHRGPWGTTGLHFDGISELSVADIARQDAVAAAARSLLDTRLGQHRQLARGTRAMQLLRYVRRAMRGDPYWLLRKDGREAYARLRMERLALIRPSRKRLSIADWQPPSHWLLPLIPMLKSADARGFVIAYVLLWVIGGATLMHWLDPATLPAIADGLSRAAGGVAGLASLAFIGDATFSGWIMALPEWVVAQLAAFASFLADLAAGLVRHFWPLVSWIFGGLAFAAGTTILLAAAFAFAIRRLESRDWSDPRIADYGHVQAVSERENAPGHEQNHIIAVMPFKRGLLRRLSFAFVMWGIKQTVTYWFRPGFVATMGTIHKARWFRVRGTNQFVFFSNYDGNWESYLEDFITRAHQGQSAAWSHGIGFPPTSFLIGEGARNGDRFKRWVRRQQRVSRVWYSRFPGLTLKQIHRNAMIEDGLARASSDTDARRWLALFGSAQREADEIETHDAQGILFSGFGRLSQATALMIRLPEDPQATRDWLLMLTDLLHEPGGGNAPPGRISFGDSQPDHVALTLAFTARGLERAGLTEGEGLEELPATFRMGMGGRSRILGDAPSDTWRWADMKGGGDGVDAVLIVYSNEPDGEGSLADLHARHLHAAGGDIIHRIPLSPVRVEGKDSLEHEHFGFRDGISQPVIRGTRRAARDVPARDVIAAGEFLLGYRNDQGYVSPSIAVGPHLDPAHNLPTMEESRPNRFPFFGNRSSAPEARDFGRNGSFLVLRELDQDVAGFRQAMDAQAAGLADRYERLEDMLGHRPDGEWLAAKIIGRWRNGQSLIAAPQPPEGSTREPDNDFAFGADDPRGLACPLGSHIRRTNPRDSLEPGDPDEQRITNRHRILRRGRSYDYVPDGRQEPVKGLLFAALCSDLDRQFEFVQAHWANARSFHGLVDEADPLLGHPGAKDGKFLTGAGEGQEARETRFTIPTPVGPVVVKGLQSYVTMQGGGYFFLPSRSALLHLVSRLDRQVGG